jgi:hypothetical protein
MKPKSHLTRSHPCSPVRLDTGDFDRTVVAMRVLALAEDGNSLFTAGDPVIYEDPGQTGARIVHHEIACSSVIRSCILSFNEVLDPDDIFGGGSLFCRLAQVPTRTIQIGARVEAPGSIIEGFFDAAMVSATRGVVAFVDASGQDLGGRAAIKVTVLDILEEDALVEFGDTFILGVEPIARDDTALPFLGYEYALRISPVPLGADFETNPLDLCCPQFWVSFREVTRPGVFTLTTLGISQSNQIVTVQDPLLLDAPGATRDPASQLAFLTPLTLGRGELLLISTLSCLESAQNRYCADLPSERSFSSVQIHGRAVGVALSASDVVVEGLLTFPSTFPTLVASHVYLAGRYGEIVDGGLYNGLDSKLQRCKTPTLPPASQFSHSTSHDQPKI